MEKVEKENKISKLGGKVKWETKSKWWEKVVWESVKKLRKNIDRP